MTCWRKHPHLKPAGSNKRQKTEGNSKPVATVANEQPATNMIIEDNDFENSFLIAAFEQGRNPNNDPAAQQPYDSQGRLLTWRGETYDQGQEYDPLSPPQYGSGRQPGQDASWYTGTLFESKQSTQ